MKLSHLALGLSLLVGSVSVAMAQNVPNGAPAADGAEGRPQRGTPAHVQGQVARFVVGPFGHVQGFSLRDGTVVMAGHHRGPGGPGGPAGQGNEGGSLSDRLAIGTTVVVDGFTHPGSNVIHRASVRLTDGTELVSAPRFGGFRRGGPEANGQRADGARPQGPWMGRRGHGPGGGGRPELTDEMREQLRSRMQARFASLAPISAAGRVQTVVGGHGHTRMVILQDGTSVMLRPGLTEGHALNVGDQIRVDGRGGAYPQGRSVIADRVTLADGTVLTAPARPAQ